VPRRSANELTPAAEQIARFRRDLEATGAAPDSAHKLGLAVSGGADSLALLLLAAAAYPGAVAAATVDHGLRAEAAEEAAFVGTVCASLGVPHATLDGPEGMAEGNLQEEARALRYALLEGWAAAQAPAIPWIATAHQRDDVAESFLMRARRGAGLSGLAAMAAHRALAGGRASLVRPLLGWSREELAGVVTAGGLTPVEDPSNHDPRFDRSRIRALLAGSPELPGERLALAARNLRHAEDALQWAAEREWRGRRRVHAHTVWLDATGLPYELRRRLVARAIDWVRCGEDGRKSGHRELAPLRGDGLDRILDTLDSGGTGTIAGVKASAKGGEWRFSEAPARRSL
jgi:tRNA(Ile)-lysidine synthase